MKDNNIYTYDIAAIILAYLRDEIDEEDQRKLEEWLKKSESHQVLLSRIRDEKMQYEDIRKILSYNANSAWLLVRQKATRKRRKRMFAIYRVAASIVVVLGVSAMLWMRKD